MLVNFRTGRGDADLHIDNYLTWILHQNESMREKKVSVDTYPFVSLSLVSGLVDGNGGMHSGHIHNAHRHFTLKINILVMTNSYKYT